MTGLARSTVSPSSSIMIRSTPWVDGCCGPMLMIIVSSSLGPRPAGEDELPRARVAGRSSCAPSSVCASSRRSSGSSSSSALERVVVATSTSSSTESLGLLAHRGPGSSLKVTGTRRGRVVLAQRVADPVVGHEDAGEVGVAGELDAEQVVDLALGEVHARVQVGEARDLGSSAGHLARSRGCGGCAGARGSWRPPRSARRATPAGTARARRRRGGRRRSRRRTA